MAFAANHCKDWFFRTLITILYFTKYKQTSYTLVTNQRQNIQPGIEPYSGLSVIFSCVQIRTHYCSFFLINSARQTGFEPARPAGIGTPFHSVTVRLRSLFCNTYLIPFPVSAVADPRHWHRHRLPRLHRHIPISNNPFQTAPPGILPCNIPSPLDQAYRNTPLRQ